MSDASDPAQELYPITPSDDVPILPVNGDYLAIRMLYVGTGGDVAVRTKTGAEVIHKNVYQGQYLGPFMITHVLQTGTTATDIIGYA